MRFTLWDTGDMHTDFNALLMRFTFSLLMNMWKRATGTDRDHDEHIRNTGHTVTTTSTLRTSGRMPASAVKMDSRTSLRACSTES